MIILSAPKISPRLLLNPVHFLSLGFGSGLAPVAPGTFGTLAAVPLYLLAEPLSLTAYILLTVFMLLAGIALCSNTSRTLGVHDHGGIVWDEITGYFITMIAAPPGWIWMVTGFALFRLFDIWKPWPIGWLDQKISGGTGIMLDDVAAGIYALLVMQITVLIIHP